MAIPKKVLNFLQKNKVKHKIVEHRTVYTALDKSRTLRVPAKVIGKTLIVKLDKEVAIALISGDQNLDKRRLKKVINIWKKKKGEKIVKEIGFAKERWLKNHFKGVKLGAVPPFGNLWKLSLFVEQSLMREKEIIVSAGDYRFSASISPKELKRLEPDLIAGKFGKKK